MFKDPDFWAMQVIACSINIVFFPQFTALSIVFTALMIGFGWTSWNETHSARMKAESDVPETSELHDAIILFADRDMYRSAYLATGLALLGAGCILISTNIQTAVIVLLGAVVVFGWAHVYTRKTYVLLKQHLGSDSFMLYPGLFGSGNALRTVYSNYSLRNL